MKKGQIFLIVGIITIIFLIMLRISFDLTKIVERKRYFELGLERDQFENVRTETLKSISIAYHEKDNITNNMEDFLRFSRDSLKREARDFNSFVVGSIYPNVTVNVNTRLNVSVLNFLGVEIQNLDLTFNSSTKSFSSIADGTNTETYFIFNTSSNINYTLSAYYKTSYENRTENISIPVEIGKNKFIGFFDLRLISDRLEQKDKFTQGYSLP